MSSFNLIGPNTADPVKTASTAKSKKDLTDQNKPYADAAAATDAAGENTKAAEAAAKAPNKANADAKKELQESKDNLAQSKAEEAKAEARADAAEASKEAAQKESAEQQQLIDDNNAAIEDLPADHPEAKALKAQNTAAKAKKEAADKKAEEEATKEKTANAEAKALDDGEAALEADIEKEEDEQELTQDAADAANKNVADAETAEAKAVEHEEEVLEEESEKYPNSFGKDAKAVEEEKDKKEAEEAAKVAEATAVEERENLEETKKETIANGDPAVMDEDTKTKINAAGSPLAIKLIITAKKAKIAAVKRAKRIKKLEKDLASGDLSGTEANAAINELEGYKAAAKSAEEDQNKILNEIMASQLSAAMAGKDHNKSYLYWDAPAIQGFEGKLEDMIAENMQPIYKHAFVGAFPGKLSNIDWLVKTMDRPKVDIEYIEQIRNNVKRQYPIKYNYGDLSMTFHDDVHHKTITILHEYFTDHIYDHKSIKAGGTFLMRDSIVIPELEVYDLTVETDQHLKYTYLNVSMVSFDFDAPDEAEDGGIHTIQAVFKIEGFKVEVAKSPSVLNIGNSPVWKPA